MNYRVVLADDEPEVLRSIQRTLDWEKYGFSVVGAFLNGLDVLEFLENHDVDIVFTDIRMPFMDGIELMHKIKEKYPYIKLVIISGYDDFQYAKEALIHGVLDYILKPINAREMSEVLQKVKDKMDTELEEKQSIQKLRNLYLENQPIIRENFLNRLVLGNIKAKALQEEKKTGLIRMGEYKYWATALARFLRISLSKGKNIITVADELEHARNYLMIQSLRAKDQFTYRIEKDPGTECFQVIKLIVQPIVENALYHGLEGMYGDGEIVIHAYTKDGDLYISVKDNGMGMSKEQAEALLDYTKELKTAKGNGIGVRNVHERIQLHFGKEYGVQIISEEDEGTEILLHLPAIMYGEKKE